MNLMAWLASFRAQTAIIAMTMGLDVTGLTRLIKLLFQEMLKTNIARSGRQRTYRMARKTDIILLLVCIVKVASADLNKGIRGRVAERLKELGLENKDPSGVLPVHSRETRESKDCPNITEDLVTFEPTFRQSCHAQLFHFTLLWSFWCQKFRKVIFFCFPTRFVQVSTT